jgi:hypothetical protein
MNEVINRIKCSWKRMSYILVRNSALNCVVLGLRRVMWGPVLLVDTLNVFCKCQQH